MSPVSTKFPSESNSEKMLKTGRFAKAMIKKSSCFFATQCSSELACPVYYNLLIFSLQRVRLLIFLYAGYTKHTYDRCSDHEVCKLCSNVFLSHSTKQDYHTTVKRNHEF